MPQQEGIPDMDLDSQLRGLFHQAEQNIEGRVAASRRAEDEKEGARAVDERAVRAYLSLPQMLRPVVLGLEALSRATGENSQLLGKLDTKLERASGNLSEANKSLPALVERLENLLEQKSGVNQRMFDALHEELKGYKESFFMESVHKPIIRNLIALYDDIAATHAQMQAATAGAMDQPETTLGAFRESLKTMTTNLEHNCEFILEVLARLEVTAMPEGSEKHDRSTQRAVAVEPASDPGSDGEIARTTKRGFLWRDRVFRPEEVVLKRWKTSDSQK